MPSWVKFSLMSFGFVSLGLTVAIWFGSARWNRKTTQFIDKLIHQPTGRRPTNISFKGFEQLPKPVAKYFRRTLKEGQPLIGSARMFQTGEFNTLGTADGWRPFEATQHISAQTPGFVWDASIRLSALLKVRVRDSYVAGRGQMQGKILALLSVVDEQDKPELNAGALHRYLAEAVWCPTALLPGEGVKWTAIDDSRALATLTDSGITVSLEFHFNELGEITGVFTSERYREVKGSYELTPWAGHFRNYEERDGIQIPLEGEVGWQLPMGNLPYWKGRIEQIKYTY
jgi:hypothetical protein